jgi:hypothetical protein
MRITRVVAAGTVCALALAVPALAATAVNSYGLGGVVFEVEATPRGQATFAACSQALEVLLQRGWQPDAAHVRIQRDPYDATSPAADVVLGTAPEADDSAFELIAGLVGRQLGRTADPDVATLLARTVAANLSAPGCERRTDWERRWVAGLASGDLLTTALPELLWRTGGDGAVREAALGSWPESAYAALAARGVEHPLRRMGEVAVAGLVNPDALGFHSLAAAAAALPTPAQGLDVSFARTGLRLIALPADAGAVAVQTLASGHATGWAVVKYALTGSFDAVPLNPAAEVSVPLRGVEWAAVVAVGEGPDGRLALNCRPLADYPVRVSRWDFLAGEDSASLAWETQRQEGLQGFVVEALRTDARGGWSVLRRTMVPVAADRESSFGYAFVDEDTKGVGGYRLLALTADGFLAEVGMFPLHAEPWPASEPASR